MGLSKNIQTPDIMWELFTEYNNWVNENPIMVQDFVGKDGDEVYRKKNRPLTMEGFENFVYDKGIAKDLDQYFGNSQDRYTDFMSVCSRIRKKIRQNQIEGGMAGIYNPSITQRLNGLVEKTDNKHEISEIKVTDDRQ